MHDGRVVVSVEIVCLGGGRVSAGVDGFFKTSFIHSSGAINHGNSGEGVKEAHDIFVFGALGGIVGVEIGYSDKSGWRIVVAREATHHGTATKWH